ncbi:uncharacterized protein LOC143032757 [Oratosquilla oratoria]|uniref:uncharacterized protein LOC143032757 n=1 Tax=Oratosquilla oratoria TaxID=337810 RepID=UPI003F75D32A
MSGFRPRRPSGKDNQSKRKERKVEEAHPTEMFFCIDGKIERRVLEFPYIEPSRRATRVRNSGSSGSAPRSTPTPTANTATSSSHSTSTGSSTGGKESTTSRTSATQPSLSAGSSSPTLTTVNCSGSTPRRPPSRGPVSSHSATTILSTPGRPTRFSFTQSVKTAQVQGRGLQQTKTHPRASDRGHGRGRQGDRPT